MLKQPLLYTLLAGALLMPVLGQAALASETASTTTLTAVHDQHDSPSAAQTTDSSAATADENDPWSATMTEDNHTSSSDQQAPDHSTTADSQSADDPWSSASDDQSGERSDPQTATDSQAANSSSANNWLQAAAKESAPQKIDWLNPFKTAALPLDQWVTDAINALVSHCRGFFQAIRMPIDVTLEFIDTALNAVPATIMLIVLTLISWQVVSTRMAIGTFFSLLLIGLIGAWPEAMTTLALVITSLIFCMILGLPSGICLARNPRLAAWIRPFLDAMQTTPAFVYLVPVVMLFGIGNVPGVVVTIIFALPPVIRLTMLGIQQVPEDLIEAGHSFGASPRQMLFKVQLPLAMPTIMAGVNQTLMLSLSMVVIASMIAVGGLGQMVLRGIGRLDIGTAAVGGVGIVLLAIVLDRFTQSLGKKERANQHWYHRGFVGLFCKPKTQA